MKGLLQIALVVAALAAVPLVIQSNTTLNFLVVTLLIALAGQGWNILGGYGGQYSFGHAAFFGTGAYITAILQVRYGVNAWLAFGAGIHWREIPRTGIDKVDVADMRYAKELGYSIKLLAVAELVPEGLELHVSPTLVRHRSPLAQVRGAYNAIRVVGDAVGRVFFHGLGAGQMPSDGNPVIGGAPVPAAPPATVITP